MATLSPLASIFNRPERYILTLFFLLAMSLTASLTNDSAGYSPVPETIWYNLRSSWARSAFESAKKSVTPKETPPGMISVAR